MYIHVAWYWSQQFARSHYLQWITDGDFSITSNVIWKVYITWFIRTFYFALLLYLTTPYINNIVLVCFQRNVSGEFPSIYHIFYVEFMAVSIHCTLTSTKLRRAMLRHEWDGSTDITVEQKTDVKHYYI